MRQNSADHLTSSDHAIDRGLQEFRDLSEMLAGSLTVKDAFRSVSSRICELVFCKSTALWLLDQTRANLLRVANWEMAADLPRGESASVEALAKRCFSTKSILLENPVDPQGEDLLPISSEGRRCTAAIPLFRGTEVIGVLQLFFPYETYPIDKMVAQLENIGTLVSPIVMNSIIFERNREKALTDSVTDLPNERAFHLVLENSIANSQRSPDDRPLSIMAIDIRNFAGINKTVGHLAGDTVLRHVGRIVRENLRAMDFVARSQKDEFLAILPTADEEVTQEIITRIERAVVEWRQSNGDETRDIQLNFGWAVFGDDGETAASLACCARLRKDCAKVSPGSRKVLPFPIARYADS